MEPRCWTAGSQRILCQCTRHYCQDLGQYLGQTRSLLPRSPLRCLDTRLSTNERTESLQIGILLQKLRIQPIHITRRNKAGREIPRLKTVAAFGNSARWSRPLTSAYCSRLWRWGQRSPFLYWGWRIKRYPGRSQLKGSSCDARRQNW
jgi:hypothetical protein